MNDTHRVQLVTALVILATFVLGGLSGAAIDRLVARAPPPPPGAPLLPLRELDLSDQQREQIRAIQEKHRPELEAILQASFPKVRAVEDEMRSEMRAVLTADQQARLERFEKTHPRPPRGAGPPPFGPPGGRPPPPPFGPPPGPPPPPPDGPR